MCTRMYLCDDVFKTRRQTDIEVESKTYFWRPVFDARCTVTLTQEFSKNCQLKVRNSINSILNRAL